MSSVNMHLVPTKLDPQELDLVAYVVNNPKAAMIVSKLCDEEGMYFNQIQALVGGSKTNTHEILEELEEIGVVSSEARLERIEAKGGPDTRAVRLFKLSDKREELMKFYAPLFKKIA